MPTPTQLHQQRLKRVQTWLQRAGWTPADSAFDYPPIVERAMRELHIQRRHRATELVAKAARRLRGETVREAGRPQQYAVLRVPVRTKLIYQRQSLDMLINEQRVIEALNGDGNEIEFQDGDGVIISIFTPGKYEGS